MSLLLTAATREYTVLQAQLTDFQRRSDDIIWVKARIDILRKLFQAYGHTLEEAAPAAKPSVAKAPVKSAEAPSAPASTAPLLHSQNTPPVVSHDEPAWTSQREAILRREWAAGAGIAAIQNAINAVPGLWMTKAGVTSKAADLNLQRPSVNSDRPSVNSDRPSVNPNEAAERRIIERLALPAQPPSLRVAPPDVPKGLEPIEATFHEIREWAKPRGYCYDGTNIAGLNAHRATIGIAPFIQVER